MENRGTKPPDELLSCSRSIVDKRLKPPSEQPQKCPRCESTNTKFCYYNNYSLSQPRYFCKTCRRYWTKGGTLRNVPVGGGCRKNKRTKRSVDQPSSNDHQESSPQGANQSHSTSSDQPARSIYGYDLEGDGGGEQQLGSFVGGFTRGLGPGSIGSSLPPLGGLSLQSLKSTFPGIDLQNTQSGPLNMVDLSCIFDAQHQQQLNSSEGLTPLNIPVEAYNSIDQQWQRLLQQQRAGLPMDDGQVSMMHLESLRDDSMRPGKTRDEEENGSTRGRGPPPTQWQMNHEGFFETPAPTDGNNNAPPPFWNHGGTTSWPDVSGFGPSTSSNPLL